MEADCCHPGVWEKDGARGFCSHTSQTSVCKTLLHWCSLSRVCLPSVFQVHFPPVAHTALHWFKKNTFNPLLGSQQRQRWSGWFGLWFFVCFCFVLPLHWRYVEFLKAKNGVFSVWGSLLFVLLCSQPFSPAPASNQVCVSFPICSISQSDPKD